MTAQPATTRFHALDALRAAMMFLGIYLHAVVAYSPNGGWPWKQAEQTRLLDWSMSVIHVFRMPIFYAMAGFFTALLIARYGMRRAAWNRFGRIVVPFVVGWLVVWPLVILLAGIGYVGLERTLSAFASGLVLKYAGPMHLWFLEYLIVLYVLAGSQSPWCRWSCLRPHGRGCCARFAGSCSRRGRRWCWPCRPSPRNC